MTTAIDNLRTAEAAEASAWAAVAPIMERVYRYKDQITARGHRLDGIDAVIKALDQLYEERQSDDETTAESKAIERVRMVEEGKLYILCKAKQAYETLHADTIKAWQSSYAAKLTALGLAEAEATSCELAAK